MPNTFVVLFSTFLLALALNRCIPDNGGMWYKNITSDYIHAGIVDAPSFEANVILLTDVAAGGSDNGVSYAKFDGVASFSGGSFATGSGSGFLPIRLSDFSAKATDRGNRISWTTESEVNNDFQMIQRSEKGLAEWTEVGVVKSSGDSQENRYYEMMDENPFATTYYRIYSVDLDGTSQVSNVISVQRSLKGKSIKLYPNPTSLNAALEINSDIEESLYVAIYDITGRLVQEISASLEVGQNEVNLDMSNFQNGIYTITIQSGSIAKTMRLFKN